MSGHTPEYVTHTHNKAWVRCDTREEADAVADRSLVEMCCGASVAVDWPSCSGAIVVYRLTPVSRLLQTDMQGGWTAEMVEVADARDVRIAELERDIAIETGTVTPPGWRRARHGLAHIETMSEVFNLLSGGCRWAARDGSTRPLDGGIVPTLAAGVRAVEEVLRG